MIDLPNTPEPRSAEPYAIDAGGWQIPAVSGGVATRIDRLGDKHGLRVTMPPMHLLDGATQRHAMVWIQRLKRGMAEGVRMKFPQPGLTLPPNGIVRAAAQAQSTLISATLSPNTQYL
jgi:hypothetical protein